MKQEFWQRAEELFHAALERPPEARRAFLNEACAEDNELRQQLEVLISKDEHAGSLLEKPVFADVPVVPARGSLVGRQFGPYRILSPLGAGGMAEVYRAGLTMTSSAAMSRSRHCPCSSRAIGSDWRVSAARRARSLR